MGKSVITEDEVILVRKARGGDERAFVALVRLYQNLVTSVTLSVLGERTMSEDAAQEAFVRAWKGLRQLKEETKFRAWLMAIARRSAIRMLSEKKREKKSIETEEESSPGPDELAARSDDLELVLQSLSELPEKYRLPMILFYREGESVAVVAEKLNLRPDAVKQQLKRGREMLRDKVESRLARALRRSAPGAAFTVGVTTVVSQVGGAGTAAAASLGTVSVTSGASVGTSSVASGATLMNSKFSTMIAVTVSLAAVPAGYGIREAIERREVAQRPVSLVTGEVDASSLDELRRRPLPPSQVVDEWQRLLEVHGKTGSGMVAINKEVGTMEDGFIRKALKSVLITEWVRVDARGGFDVLFNGRDWESRDLLLEEWMKADPQEALTAIIAWTEEDAERWFPSNAALVLAERSPDLFIEALSQFRFQVGTSGPTTEGLALIASQRPFELRDAALKLEGEGQRVVLSAALKGWAETDPLAALKWIQANEAADERVQSERFFAVASGWSEERPEEFLAKLDSICEARPKSWERGSLYSRLATLALAEVAKEDLEGAFLWWGKNRDKVRMEQVHFEMASVIRGEVTRDPGRMIRILEDYDLLEESGRFFRHGGNTQDLSAKWRELAEAVQEVEKSAGRDELVKAVARELQQRSTGDALAFVELAEGNRRDSPARESVIRGLVGRDMNLKRVKELAREFPKWANDLQAEALERVLSTSRVDGKEIDHREWIPIFENLMVQDHFEEFNTYQPYMVHLGAPYLAEDAEAARSWMHAMMEGRMDASIEDDLVGQAIGEWVIDEPERAMAWISEKGLTAFSDSELQGMSRRVASMKGGLPFFWEIFQAIEPGDARIGMVESALEYHGVEAIRAGLEEIALTTKERRTAEIYMK